MTDPAPFAKRLKQAREKAELSQKRLGVLAGIEESNASAVMNQYERGTHLPKFPLVRSLASVLNVPTAFFYSDDDELADLLMLFQQLSTKNRSAILDEIRSIKQPGNYEGDYRGGHRPTIHE
ncbi:MAG: helix-turn-helix domain-containing protein [Gammaproteobacteria bacterium]